MRNESSGVLIRFPARQSGDLRVRLRVALSPASARRLQLDSAHRTQFGGSRGADHRELLAHPPGPARFDPARGFEGWARRIATHAALDWLRAQRTQSELSMEVCAAFAAPGRGRSGHNRENTLEDRTGLVAVLPPKLRIAATLAVIEEFPQKEVAAALGISVAAVKLRVFRALRLLRKDLERQGITP